MSRVHPDLGIGTQEYSDKLERLLTKECWGMDRIVGKPILGRLKFIHYGECETCYIRKFCYAFQRMILHFTRLYKWPNIHQIDINRVEDF